MESWYVPIGLLVLGGLFWLGSQNYTILRLIMGIWGLCLAIGGVGLFYATFRNLQDTTWTLRETIQALLGSAVLIGMGAFFLYGGYRLMYVALAEKEDKPPPKNEHN